MPEDGVHLNWYFTSINAAHGFTWITASHTSTDSGGMLFNFITPLNQVPNNLERTLKLCCNCLPITNYHSKMLPVSEFDRFYWVKIFDGAASSILHVAISDSCTFSIKVGSQGENVGFAMKSTEKNMDFMFSRNS